MKTVIAGALIILSLVHAPIQQDTHKEKPWKNIGSYRITVFCQYCNDPPGYQSKSGKKLKYGDVAMNDIPLGSQISIEGEKFTVKDRCGMNNTVDIFIPSNTSYCTCNYLNYKDVFLKK